MTLRKPSIGQVFWFVLIPIAVAVSVYGFNFIVGLAEGEATKVAAAIQAIGSVGAILIAVAVPAWLHLKTENSKENDRKIFAAAFGVHLLPQLLAIKESVQLTVTDLTKCIAALSDPNMDVDFTDHGDSIYPQKEFIRTNWAAVAQLDGDTARAVVNAISLHDASLDHINVETEVESMGDGEGNEWYVIHFGSLTKAQGYLQGNRRTLEQVNIAIARLETSKTGDA